MFKSLAIVLDIKRIRDNKILINLFTREYGRISCWYKKKDFHYDLWDITEIHIDRHLWENLLKGIESINRVHTENWNYSAIISFLETLNVFYILLPEWSLHTQTFDDYLALMRKIQLPNTPTKTHYTLFQFRTLKQLWYINGNDFKKSSRLEYIHKNISVKPIHAILESKTLHQEEEDFLRRINEKTLYQLK